jgi:hypothetical protein
VATRKLVPTQYDAQLAEWEAKIAGLRASSEKAAPEAELEAAEANPPAAQPEGAPPGAPEAVVAQLGDERDEVAADVGTSATTEQGPPGDGVR